jgi:hypothetical protein
MVFIYSFYKRICLKILKIIELTVNLLFTLAEFIQEMRLSLSRQSLFNLFILIVSLIFYERVDEKYSRNGDICTDNLSTLD